MPMCYLRPSLWMGSPLSQGQKIIVHYAQELLIQRSVIQFARISQFVKITVCITIVKILLYGVHVLWYPGEAPMY